METAQFRVTTTIKKISKLQNKVKILQGGTSAGKTFGIVAWLIDKALRSPNLRISIVSESMPHLKRGAMRDFFAIMKLTKRWDVYKWKQFEYNFSNGSYIEFFSADKSDKLRGARRDILYINEANNIPFEAYYELRIRSKEVYLCYNPVSEFWVHTELLKDNNVDILILTYRDNEALDKDTIVEIEANKKKAETSDYWRNWWRVYGEGEVGVADGLVFTDWEIIDNLPMNAKLIGGGLDFGYSNDPTAVVGVYLHDGKRYLRQFIYQKGLTNSELANLIKSKCNGLGTSYPLYCDISEPKSIAELRLCGLPLCLPCEKGNDSVMHGINLMQQNRYYTTKDSLDIIKEFRNYSFIKDKTSVGGYANVPVDAYNHGIDAIRYHEMKSLKYKGQSMKIV